MKPIVFVLMALGIMTSCSNKRSEATPIGENTFVYDAKVFRIIDNEVTQLGNLETDSITKTAVLNPILKNYGSIEMDYIREGATSELTAVYRGDMFYFKMELYGLNDLRAKYLSGTLAINFLDEYGFQIHSTSVDMTELIQIVGDDNEPVNFEYNGQTQMSSEVYQAIATYSISSSLREYPW